MRPWAVLLPAACALAVACTGAIAPTAAPDPSAAGGRNGGGGSAGGSEGPPGAGPRPVGGAGGAGGTVIPVRCATGTPTVGPGRWRRLTIAQYRNTVRDLLGFEPDTGGFLLDTNTGPFASNARLAPQDVEVDKYRDAAETLAARAVADLPKVLACDTKAMTEDACAAKFIADFGARAFRRPLKPVETAAFMKLYAVGKEESFATGVRLVIEAALQAPSFLYQVEVGAGAGDGPRKLDGYEVASRLSYLLWGTMPDPTLFAAVRAGKLAEPEGLQAEAMRLLASPRFLDAAATFFLQLLEVEALARPGVVTKEPGKYPEFSAPLGQAMLGEIRSFVQHVFAKGDGSIEALLSAPWVFPTGPLSSLYGVSAGTADTRVEIKDGSRMGLLTQAGVLASHPAVPTHFAAVLRGHLVRRNLLCSPVPPPVVAVEFNLPANADKLSQQELLRVHQENPTCKGCHQLMDPIGFGFESYDLIGRHRPKTADGTLVDTSGEIASSDVAGRFADTRELITKLARSTDVRACLATQWFRFALARSPVPDDDCARMAVERALSDGAGDIRKGILALVASDAFRFRRGE